MIELVRRADGSRIEECPSRDEIEYPSRPPPPATTAVVCGAGRRRAPRSAAVGEEQCPSSWLSADSGCRLQFEHGMSALAARSRLLPEPELVAPVPPFFGRPFFVSFASTCILSITPTAGAENAKLPNEAKPGPRGTRSCCSISPRFRYSPNRSALKVSIKCPRFGRTKLNISS